jgi:hypothetical protein
MPSILKGFVGGAVQGFANPENSKEKKDGYVELIVVLLTFFISLVILSLIGKFLWNGVIVDLFAFARPAKSFWQILGLFIFSSLVLC